MTPRTKAGRGTIAAATGSIVVAILIGFFLEKGTFMHARGSLAAVLLMTCDVKGTHVLTPMVVARDDGVHVLVLESGGYEAVEMWGGDRNPVGRTYYTTGHSFAQAFTYPLAPGRWSFACFSGPQSNPRVRGQNGGADVVEVVDPFDSFVPYGLSCPKSDRTGFPVPIFTPAASVDALVRGQLNGVLVSDEIEPAGYPMGDGRDWRVVRGGEVVGSLRARAEGGRGIISSVSVCASSGITA